MGKVWTYYYGYLTGYDANQMFGIDPASDPIPITLVASESIMLPAEKWYLFRFTDANGHTVWWRAGLTKYNGDTTIFIPDHTVVQVLRGHVEITMERAA